MLEGYGVTLSEIGAKNGEVMDFLLSKYSTKHFL